ncbi:MAG TPA: 3-deoxy-D-manno-octulosonic acid kinase [Pseudomonadaceae bacterium]|nr:3-deoxy-D-manno-octulosonic acid kinase [Pseudomonadaceae bacterium]
MQKFNNSTNQTFPCSRILSNPDIVYTIPENLFDCSQHSCDGEFLDSGRGTVVLFSYLGQEMVLKTYHRGGLPGRFVRESYLYTGVYKTRMWKEFHMLMELHTLGLPVPRPIAARCELSGPFVYRGQLLMEKIPHSNTLAEVITETELSDHTWGSIGEIIARFHAHGIYHSDLNASNILLTKDLGIYLIDFDKCSIHPPTVPTTTWFESNLRRLKRSLLKYAEKTPTFHFDDGKWQELKKGYDGIRVGITQGLLTLVVSSELAPTLLRLL